MEAVAFSAVVQVTFSRVSAAADETQAASFRSTWARRSRSVSLEVGVDLDMINLVRETDELLADLETIFEIGFLGAS